MYILPVSQFNSNPPRLSSLYNSPVIRSMPVRDTVSFTSGEKNLDSKVLDVTNAQAKDVCNGAKDEAQRLRFILKRYLGKYTATPNHPDNPICAGEKGIKVRVKSEFSTIEKASGRSLLKTKEIKSMGDVIGARIVLREASKKNIDLVLNELLKAVEKGELKILEIENYRLPDGTSYASSKALKNFKSKCDKHGFVKFSDSTVESGYTAIHLGIRLNDGYNGEIQIMGCDVEALKELEDLVYKLRCNKGVASKYKSLQAPLEKAYKSLTGNNQEIYMKYVRDSYTRARKIEPKPMNSRKRQEYLLIPYFLPQELDFENLSKMVEKLNK